MLRELGVNALRDPGIEVLIVLFVLICAFLPIMSRYQLRKSPITTRLAGVFDFPYGHCNNSFYRADQGIVHQVYRQANRFSFFIHL